VNTPPQGFHLSKTKKIIILDYFKPYYPLRSVFNSLKIQNEPFLSTGAPGNPISLNSEHPPLGFHWSKTKKIIILDYFKPYYPLGSFFNSLKIQNEPFFSTGAPRNPISLNSEHPPYRISLVKN